MNSERSDIDVKVALEVSNGTGYDDNNRRIEIILERTGKAEFTAEVEAYGFDESDAGARAVSEALDLVALGIDRALPDEDPEAEALTQAVDELVKAGLSRPDAHKAAFKTLALLRGDGIPAQEPMHPQDPERRTQADPGRQSVAEEMNDRRDAWSRDAYQDALNQGQTRPQAERSIHEFETPQRVRDARAARRAERKGFNPRPKGGK